MRNNTRFSARASLAVVGRRLRQMKVWQTIEQHVRIKQKVIKYKPLDKLLDALINILAGGQGMVEVNSRVRPDEALQRAFGREGCAEQSVVSETLNVCTEETVVQMRQALQEVYRSHSQGYRHDYSQSWQVLDVDMSGMPAGRQGEGVSKGYFSGKKNQRGRQLGRVVATRYDEIVVERLYSGKTQLERSLQPLVTAAAEVLGLDTARRQRTIVRSDGGGGRDEDVNWLLESDYLILVKVKNWRRATKLAQSVTTWYTDPKTGDRQVGWVEEPHAYARPTRQVALRVPRKQGGWTYRVLVFNLPDELLFWLAQQPVRHAPTPIQTLLAVLYAYDRRRGGGESSIKGSKQGLGLTKRNKRRFAAQEMLVLLAQLAYNLVAWTQCALARHAPTFQPFGILRMVRDVFHITGTITLDAQGRILEITLNQAHALALPFLQAMSASLTGDDDLSLNLGQI
jgi:hypothetical protein